MPSAVLLQAIDRLDQAVVKAEAACEKYLSAQRTVEGKRRAEVQAAIKELDTLISAMRSPAEEEASHG